MLCFPEAHEQLQAGVGDRLSHEEIPLESILGSVELCGDCSRTFLPLKDSDQQRWTRVRQAFVESKPMPPIQVVQAGQAYFVIDGHHRVSVARQLGLSHLDAKVLQAESQAPHD